MKVSYWADTVWPHIGGAEIISRHLTASLEKKGYEIHVVAERGDLQLPQEPQGKETPVYYFPFRDALRKNNLEEIVVLREKIKRLKEDLKPDLYHINLYGPAPLFHLQTAAIHKAPNLVTVHSLPAEKPDQTSFIKTIMNMADWVTLPSEAMINRARQWFPEIIPKSSVIYNSLNMPDIQAKPLNFNDPCLLCLGRISREKGFDLVVDAFGLIVKAFPNAQLVIAGDGLNREVFEKYVGRLSFKEKVKFTGWVDPQKVLDLINSSTIVLTPSRWFEPFCLVALQASYMARPVVATRMGGLPEVIIDQETGVLVDNEDRRAIAQAVISLLEHPQEAVRLGQNGKDRARSLFAWQRFVDEYDALYKRLLNKKK